MEEQLINFQTAKLAKEKEFGYDFGGTHYVHGFYSEDGISYKETEIQQEDACRDDYYLRPTQSLLQKYLREIYQIDITIHRSFSMTKSYHYCIIVNNDYENELPQGCIRNRKYEEALEDGLQEALKLNKL